MPQDAIWSRSFAVTRVSNSGAFRLYCEIQVPRLIPAWYPSRTPRSAAETAPGGHRCRARSLQKLASIHGGSESNVIGSAVCGRNPLHLDWEWVDCVE